MRSAFIFPVLASLAAAAPQPQGIVLDVIASIDPVLVTPAYDVVSQSATAAPTSSITPITTDAVGLRKRDGNCAPQPAGSGPVPTLDTAEAFVSYPQFAVSSCNVNLYRFRLTSFEGYGKQRTDT